MRHAWKNNFFQCSKNNVCKTKVNMKKYIRAGSDLLLNISLAGGQSLK